MSFVATLISDEQGKAVLRGIWPKVQEYLKTGEFLLLKIEKLSKSREQEEKYHAQIADIYRHFKPAGSTWSREDWKRLLIDQWAQDCGQDGTRVAPSLDGRRVVQLQILSRHFKVDEASSFIEWLYAWGADKGVVFSE